MIKQKIMRVDFMTGELQVIPVFYELMNSSQLKNLSESKTRPDKIFSTLLDMNEDGWKLESIHSATDDKFLPYQVAIFTQLQPDYDEQLGELNHAVQVHDNSRESSETNSASKER